MQAVLVAAAVFLGGPMLLKGALALLSKRGRHADQMTRADR